MIKASMVVAATWVVLTASARAQSCAAYPNALTNGTTADANQVMGNFNCAALVGAARFTGSVGVNEPSPVAPLDVAGDIHVSGTTSPVVTAQGAYLSWNALTGSTGETDLINNQGGGSGGFAFMNTPSSGSPLTTLMYITGSGAVGIGTTSPGSLLTVAGTEGVTGTLYVNNTGNSSGTSGTLQLGDGTVTKSSGNDFFFNSGIRVKSLGLNQGLVFNSSLTTGIWGDSSNKIYLVSGGATVLTTTSTGNVGVGTASPSTSYVFNVVGATGAGAASWNIVSDARLKDHVTDFKDGLSMVGRLRPVRFDWAPVEKRTVGKDLKLPVGRPQVGFIAQEVEKVLPEAVTAPAKGSHDPYGMQETKLIPVLVEAIKEQQAQIKALEARLGAQNARIDALSAGSAKARSKPSS